MQLLFSRILITCCGAAMLSGTAMAAPAPTQAEIEKDLSIRTRKHPEFDPMGVRVDDFLILPSVKLDREYNDNIYAVDRARTSDALFVLSPEVVVKSDFARHQVQAEVGMDTGKYDSNSGEDYMDYHAGVGGRVDVTGNVSVPLAARYSHQHARRSSPDDKGGLEPTEYDAISQKTGLTFANHSITIKGTGGLEYYDFQNTPTALGFVNHQDRNRSILTGGLSVGFPEEGYVVPFTYTGVKEVDYDDAVDDNGVNRDATEIYYGIGADVNLSSILRSRVKVGMVDHNMQDARFSTATAMTYGMDLTWEPSTLAAITLKGERSIEETTLAGFAVSVDSTLTLIGKYELAPNIIITPGVEYLLREYEGAGNIELEQETALLGITYKLNRNLWVDVAYNYTVQDASSPRLTDFESNLIMLSLTAHY